MTSLCYLPLSHCSTTHWWKQHVAPKRFSLIYEMTWWDMSEYRDPYAVLRESSLNIVKSSPSLQLVFLESFQKLSCDLLLDLSCDLFPIKYVGL
jgi:hypothetical protein